MSLSSQTSPGLRIQFSAWGVQPHCSEPSVIPQGTGVSLALTPARNSDFPNLSFLSCDMCVKSVTRKLDLTSLVLPKSTVYKVKFSFRTKNQTLRHRRTSLVVHWLRLDDSTAGDTGLIPGQGTKILYVVQHGQKGKKKNHCLKKGEKWLRNPFSLSKVSFGNFKSISKT